jgi:hypothetical protein
MLKVQSSAAENAILTQIGAMRGSVAHPDIQQRHQGSSTKHLLVRFNNSITWDKHSTSLA